MKCGDCGARLGFSLPGPRDTRIDLLLRPLHRCRSAAQIREILVGKPEDFLERIIEEARREDFGVIVLLAQQALHALRAP